MTSKTIETLVPELAKCLQAGEYLIVSGFGNYRVVKDVNTVGFYKGGEIIVMDDEAPIKVGSLSLAMRK